MSPWSKGSAVSLQSVQRSYSDLYLGRAQVELDVLMTRLHREARRIHAVTARGCLQQKRELVERARRGDFADATWDIARQSVDRERWNDLARARVLSRRCVASSLYERSLDDLECDLRILEALGEAKRLVPLVAQRYGTGAETCDPMHSPSSLLTLADRLLGAARATEDPAVVPAQSNNGFSVARLVRRLGADVGLRFDVRVEPKLMANAAVGDRTVFIADRYFGRREARRVAVHEVLGHMVSAHNGRTQALGVLSLGTGRAFEDQEGVAIYLEERAGLLDGNRLRTLGARVVATSAVHRQQPFSSVVRRLVREHGFDADQAVSIGLRAYRGGGVARDCVYMRGWLRVRRAIAKGQATLAQLQVGKVSLQDLQAIDDLRAQGLIRPAVYTPSLRRSLGSTDFGTSFATSPPSLVTSLTRLDAT